MELGLSPPLPTRDGVGASCIALPSVNEFASDATSARSTIPSNGENIFPKITHAENSLNTATDRHSAANLFSAGTIAHFLVQQFPTISAPEWLRRMAAGDVVDEHGVAVTPTRAFEAGLRIYYYRALETEPCIPFDEVILFQDKQLVVVDKPHFLPVIPSGRYLQETLLVRLKRKLGVDSLTPIHRIDRDTAGVIVFSAQEKTRGMYQQLFATREVRKTYEAVAPINRALHFPFTHTSCMAPDEHFMRMKEINGEANTQTQFEVIRELTPALALYRLHPITGRKHQLRVHCAALAIPIVNDPMYPEFLPEPARDAPEDFSKPLQLLARAIEFTDPITGSARTFTSARQLELLAAHP